MCYGQTCILRRECGGSRSSGLNPQHASWSLSTMTVFPNQRPNEWQAIDWGIRWRIRADMIAIYDNWSPAAAPEGRMRWKDYCFITVTVRAAPLLLVLRLTLLGWSTIQENGSQALRSPDAASPAWEDTQAQELATNIQPFFHSASRQRSGIKVLAGERRSAVCGSCELQRSCPAFLCHCASDCGWQRVPPAEFVSFLHRRMRRGKAVEVD
jgi:hypothetical protein